MIFFTDITTNISNFCMLNIKKYNDKRKLTKNLIFVDPSVYELKNSAEYSRIYELHKLTNNLRDNEFISIDYPCDMNEYYTGTFIEKSYWNNIQYANNPKYICTIQYKFKDFKDFVFQTERLRKVWERPEKIIGIGNLCRIMHCNEFSDKVFYYICKNMKNKWIHIYGMSLRHIKKYVPLMEDANIKISVDSTKWTKRVHTRPPLDKKICCRKDTRDIYFLEYIKTIKKFVKNVIY